MRVLVAFVLALLVAAGVAMAATRGGDAPSLNSVRTAFEIRGGAEWTSLREEREFLRKLDARSARIGVSVVARSGEGRPLRLISVGPARTRRQIAAGLSVLFVCGQHGNEPAGREACLQAARDAVDDVGSRTLLILPTANPDGLVRDERGNADGTDVNRDHLELRTPEARTIAAVIRDYRPDLVGDFHEYRREDADEVLLSNPDRLHLGVDSRIRRLTRGLHDHAVRSLRAQRLETGLYPSLSEDADDSVLRQQAALRHAPSLLVETPRLGTLSPRRRVGAHRAAAGALISMLRTEGRGLAAATSAARLDAAGAGASGRRRYYYRSPTSYSNTPPCGYELSQDQYRDVQDRLRLHGVAARPSGSSWFVPMAQASQPVIGLLLDSRAPGSIADGTPVDC